MVVDLKNGPGDVALFLGLRPRHSLLTALDHLAWIDPATLRRFVVEHDCGLHVLAAGDEFGRPGPARSGRTSNRLLRALNTLYDFVILDAGTSLIPPSTTALQLSDAIMLVANPDVPCLRNLQRIIDAVRAAGVATERLQIVLNRASEFGVLSTAQIERVLGFSICVQRQQRLPHGRVGGEFGRAGVVAARSLSSTASSRPSPARWPGCKGERRRMREASVPTSDFLQLASLLSAEDDDRRAEV